MNLKYIFIVFFIAFNLYLKAQTTISGIVTDSLKNPVPFASVYLSNSTMGTSANAEGAYKLNITQKGVYELIVTCIGYKTYSKTIHVEEKNMVFNISLHPIHKILNEVVVTARGGQWKRNYALFLETFLGETENAFKCKILNPEDLRLYNDRKEGVLSGYSVKPLIIENKALGYNIEYTLNDFKFYHNKMVFKYSGNYYFKLNEGSPKEIEQWEANRLDTYYGSRMHFLRSLYFDKLDQEGFTVYEYKDENTDFAFNNKALGMDALRFNKNVDNIEVYYPRKIIVYYESRPGQNVNLINFKYKQYSSKAIIARPIRIYANGFFEDGYSITWEGKMSHDRVANMLPFDYVPEK